MRNINFLLDSRSTMILNKCDSNSSPPSPGDVVHPALGNAVNLVHKISYPLELEGDRTVPQLSSFLLHEAVYAF